MEKHDPTFRGADGSRANQAFHLGDRVELQNLAEPKQLKYNGKSGNIVACAAERGRWQVVVELPVRKKDRVEGIADRQRKKRFWVATSHLRLLEAGMVTQMSMSGMDPAKHSTAANEAADPPIAGFFDFIKGGDVAAARRVLEHMSAHCVARREYAADHMMDGAGNTALIGAIENGYAELAEMLIEEFGADCMRVYMGGTPMGKQMDARFLHVAVKQFSGDERIIRALCRGGADPNDNSRHFGTPLMGAAMSAAPVAVELFKLLLELGAKPRGVFSTNGGATTTLLHTIYQNPDSSMCKTLIQLALEAGADPGEYSSAPGIETSTVLLCAASRNNVPILRALLRSELGRKAVDLTTKDDSFEETALHYALGNKTFDEDSDVREVALLLLEHGARPDIPCARGVTALNWLSASESKGRGELREAYDAAKRAGPCHNCGLLIVRCKPKVCSACRRRHYCSARCAKRSWRKGHKAECKLLSKLRVNNS